MYILSNDLILSFGSDHPAKLLACSQVLRVASHEFAAMFTNNFAEGQTLSHLTPKDVKLAEDDPESMRIVISVLHHRNCHVPLSLDMDRILSIARLANEYDLSAALRWPQPAGSNHYTGWLGNLRHPLNHCLHVELASRVPETYH